MGLMSFALCRDTRVIVSSPTRIRRSSSSHHHRIARSQPPVGRPLGWMDGWYCLTARHVGGWLFDLWVCTIEPCSSSWWSTHNSITVHFRIRDDHWLWFRRTRPDPTRPKSWLRAEGDHLMMDELHVFAAMLSVSVCTRGSELMVWKSRLKWLD